eukprot:6672997-Pyramimonas_sp.AAC.1
MFAQIAWLLRAAHQSSLAVASVPPAAEGNAGIRSQVHLSLSAAATLGRALDERDAAGQLRRVLLQYLVHSRRQAA